LVAEVGEECVADSILCVEYFPYHSQSFNHSRLRLPSQEYSFQLVREAIRRRVIIFNCVARGCGQAPFRS
jgi:hypothetical protein